MHNKIKKELKFRLYPKPECISTYHRITAAIFVQILAVLILGDCIEYVRLLRVRCNTQWVVLEPSCGVVVVRAVTVVLDFQRAAI